jgi:hypothetical protein
MKKPIAAAALAASLLVGGGIGVALFGPSVANAQTSTTPPAATSPTGSNEDATHEAAESPARAAAEDAGTAFGGGRHGSNEDPTHEGSESAAREAEEDAAAAGGSSSTPSTADPTAPTPSI